MDCFIYFLYSDKLKKYYVGISNNVAGRLYRHNTGQSISTKNGVPWKLLYTITCESKSIAMQQEIRIKKRGIARFLLDNNIRVHL